LGYFGCRGRDGNKIYQKQIELSKNINKILKNSLLYLLNKDEKEKFVNLLSKMLEFDYKKRILIKDAINHEFFNEDENE
jgi:serine/threonine protein kinase